MKKPANERAEWRIRRRPLADPADYDAASFYPENLSSLINRSGDCIAVDGIPYLVSAYRHPDMMDAAEHVFAQKHF
ncbi:hypothetical protein [Paracoccus aminophilus]|uniref:hypothetical protein n=1 Tax=Paracoccus aminophilus TaxID=34003 RepID=UPI0011DDA985|nr:hypothetical protein [Paracoccus aminophilus]